MSDQERITFGEILTKLLAIALLGAAVGEIVFLRESVYSLNRRVQALEQK